MNTPFWRLQIRKLGHNNVLYKIKSVRVGLCLACFARDLVGVLLSLWHWTAFAEQIIQRETVDALCDKVPSAVLMFPRIDQPWHGYGRVFGN